MKAIIMAGGEGSRLRPLTCDCPKPMLQLLGRPLMEYAVRLLENHGVEQIAATLGYLPDSIVEYFGEDARLQYYIEDTPLGTAGSVKRAQGFLDERFIVLSGDGISDIDLSAAVRFHEERRALATLVLKKSACPQEYGMVVTAPNGRIRAFHEKPGHSDIYSNLINTGIYILEPEILDRIPNGHPYDFGHDLFPALVKEGLPVYGYAAAGYWCDVGDVAAYLRVHADALDGRIRLPGLAPCTEGAILEPGCSVEGPVYIAPGAHIAAGAHIGSHCVIGEDCFVQSGANLKRSLLLPGAQVAAGAQLRGCILGREAAVGSHAQLFEESVVGSSGRVGARATLPPGVKLWPGKAVSGGERPEENIVWGALRRERFIGGALQLESPAQATRAAQACMAQLRPREVLMGRGASCVAAALWHAAASGIMAQGVQVIDAGICSLPGLRRSLAQLRADAAILIEDEALLPLASDGSILAEKLQRSMLKLLERQDFPSPFRSITRPVVSAGDPGLSWIAGAAAMFTADARCAPRIVLCADQVQMLTAAEQCLTRAGLHVRTEDAPDAMRPSENEIGIYLPGRGETAVFSDAHGVLSEAQRQLACAHLLLELGEERLILPNHFTRAIEAIAAEHDVRAVYMQGETAAWMSVLAEHAPLQFDLQFDGLCFALGFIALLVREGLSLDRWRRQVPGAFRIGEDIPVPFSESARLLHSLAEGCPEAQLGGGVRLPGRNGWAWIAPDDAGSQLCIFAEATDMEAAREICGFYSGEIRRLLQAQD